MPKPTNGMELLGDIRKERTKFEALLETIPKSEKNQEVCDDMSVKDSLAHRAEWANPMRRSTTSTGCAAWKAT